MTQVVILCIGIVVIAGWVFYALRGKKLDSRADDESEQWNLEHRVQHRTVHETRERYIAAHPLRTEEQGRMIYGLAAWKRRKTVIDG